MTVATLISAPSDAVTAFSSQLKGLGLKGLGKGRRVQGENESVAIANAGACAEVDLSAAKAECASYAPGLSH